MTAGELPFISVVMAVYNGEKYVKESVLSILHQTLTKFEFIIINDGSTDESATILEQIASTDRRIRVVHQENCGLSVSLNKGIRMSRGKYIARMDADDISLPQRLETQAECMEKSNAAVCHSLVDIIDPEGRSIPLRRNVGSRLSPLQTRWALLWNNCISHPTVMLNRAVLLNQSFEYDTETLCEGDYELWCRVSRVSDFLLIRKALVKYRKQPESMTHSNGESHVRSLGAIISRNIGTYLGWRLDEEQSRELAILSGQTYLGRSYSAYQISPACFLALIEIVRKGFINFHQLGDEQVQEVNLACSKLCVRWSKTSLFKRTYMASRFLLAAIEYAGRSICKC